MEVCQEISTKQEGVDLAHTAQCLQRKHRGIISRNEKSPKSEGARRRVVRKECSVSEKDVNHRSGAVTRSSWVSMAIVSGMALWLFSGDFTAETAGAAEAGNGLATSAQKAFVQGVESRATPRAVTLDVLGRTEANRQVEVRSEIAGIITEVNATRGQYVEAGDSLCEIAVDNRSVRLQEAEAAFQSAAIEYQGAKDLSESGLQSKVVLAKLKAAAVRSKATLETARLELAKTSIRAPFSGFIERRAVEVGDLITAGASCATVLEVAPLLAVGQVSEKEVSWLQIGQPVKVAMGDSGGDNLTTEGAISFVARTPDPATRSYRVEARLENVSGASRVGITARMSVPVAKEMAHLISPASLTLNADGEIGVKTVVDGGTVTFIPVSTIGEETSGLWVTGLPGKAVVITVGHQEVVPGQVVDVRLADGAA